MESQDSETSLKGPETDRSPEVVTMKRWVGYWLAFCFGLPVMVAFVYVLVHQRLLDSPGYYPYWLAESYFYPGLPAMALLTWKVHWGKKNPLAYFMLTVTLFAGVIYVGTGNVLQHLGDPVKEKIRPLGMVDSEVITSKGKYQILYFPLNRTHLVEKIRQGGTVEVFRVEGKGLILSFTDGVYRSYPLRERLLDFALRVLAVGMLAIFFYVVMKVWWRDLEVEEDHLRILCWGKVKTIPFSALIQLRLDSLGEEIQVETEKVVNTFLYDSKTARELAAAAEGSGLTPIQNGCRWIRSTQFREIRLGEERLEMDGGEGVDISYNCVAVLLWDPVIQITLQDGSDFVITDSRYTDRAWFDELAHKVKEAWRMERQGYAVDVDPRGKTVALTLREWLE